MAIKVYGNFNSTGTLRVLACLIESRLDYEFISVDMRAGENKKEPFLSLNPYGQVPVLQDGNIILFESRAINQYLVYNYTNRGTQFLCRDMKKMASVIVWSEVESQRYDPPASKLTWELSVKPILGMSTDDAIVEEQELNLAKVLDVYEARLAQSKYLGGDFFHLADLHHLPTLHYLMATRVRAVFDLRPHVSAWIADITARPAWQKVIAMISNSPK